MQPQAPEKRHLKPVPKTDKADGEKPVVHSLAAARMRRARRIRAERPLPPELAGLDLRTIDMDRMTPQAREHFWFNMNRYARSLFGTAAEKSALEYAQADSPVTADHIRQAEIARLSRVRRVERSDLGLGFALDALQILGAALRQVHEDDRALRAGRHGVGADGRIGLLPAVPHPHGHAAGDLRRLAPEVEDDLAALVAPPVLKLDAAEAVGYERLQTVGAVVRHALLVVDERVVALREVGVPSGTLARLKSVLALDLHERVGLRELLQQLRDALA